MKKSTMVVVLTVASLGATAAQAGEFDGGYVGGKIGVNRTDMTAVSRQSPIATGLEGGYNWNRNGMLLGVDGFLDFNGKKTHTGVAPAPATVHYGSHVYGLDLKLGLPNGNWMPFAKLGYAHTGGRGDAYASVVGDSGAHYGLGVEYKFAPQWSVAGEWTNNTGKSGATKLNNDNFTIGVNYYFEKPYVAPPTPAAAPVVKKEEPKAVPKVAPEPAPKEAWKVIMEEKPVRIEGASFDTNSAKLKPTADAKLQQVVDFAGKYPEANLEVTGHTDDRGGDAYNQKLSERRAAAVKAYLVKKGIAAGRITAKGYGKTMPMADNKTKEGRAANRRVEVRYTIREEKKVRIQ
ncbi:MAG TPA: OmpA family protein [Gallionella sp.]|nr:OmpA family protein [Gallionella sp.]